MFDLGLVTSSAAECLAEKAAKSRRQHHKAGIYICVYVFDILTQILTPTTAFEVDNAMRNIYKNYINNKKIEKGRLKFILNKYEKKTQNQKKSMLNCCCC